MSEEDAVTLIKDALKVFAATLGSSQGARLPTEQIRRSVLLLLALHQEVIPARCIADAAKG